MIEPSPELSAYLLCKLKAYAATATFFDGVEWYSVADLTCLKEPYSLLIVEDSRQDDISDSMWVVEYLVRFHQGKALETDISEPVENKATRDDRRVRFGQAALEMVRAAVTPPTGQAYFLAAPSPIVPGITPEPGRWHIQETTSPSFKALEGDQVVDGEFVSETRFTVKLRWVAAEPEEE